jgi:hypothetical protein
VPPNRFWFGNAARAAPTLTQGISVFGNESVEPTPRIAKREPLSQCANEPSGREQVSQTRDRIPANKYFTSGCDDMQLPQAFIHLESGIDR